MNEYDYYNHSEDYEANYHLRKNKLRETRKNREILNSLVPKYSTHKEVDEIIRKNLDKFEKDL